MRTRLGIAAAVLTLAGCGSGSHATGAHSSATADPSASFVSTARHLTSTDMYIDLDDASLVNDGEQICADYKAGRLVYGNTVTASDLVQGGGFTWAQAAGLQKAARSTLCPASR